MSTITVFTPTYNRAYILPQLYKSLCEQTSKDFCWLIVDDGSSDNTKELVKNWINEAIIKIKYFYKDNGGKMRAHNFGVAHTETELFVCVDSDDYLTQMAIEHFIETWKKKVKKENTAGIVAYRGKKDGSPLVNQFPEGITESTLSGLYNRGFAGDTTLIFKTKILQKYLFPEIPGEKFITEGYVYDQIDKDYKLYVLREVGIICEYQEDGYTRNNLRLERDNPKGWVLFYRQRAALTKPFVKKLRYSAYANCFEILSHTKHPWLTCDYRMLNILSYVISLRILYRYKKGFKTLV